MTENSKVLALKYRPQVFEDLIGQEVIAETIKNSLEELAFHCEDMHVLGVYKAHEFREKK